MNTWAMTRTAERADSADGRAVKSSDLSVCAKERTDTICCTRRTRRRLSSTGQIRHTHACLHQHTSFGKTVAPTNAVSNIVMGQVMHARITLSPFGHNARIFLPNLSKGMAVLSERASLSSTAAISPRGFRSTIGRDDSAVNISISTEYYVLA